MDLEEIASVVMTDEVSGKRLAKNICQNLKGRVHRSVGDIFQKALMMGLLCALWYFCMGAAGRVLQVIFSVPLWIVCLIVLWDRCRWEMTFDGETGWFSLTTLSGGDRRFHASEIRRAYIREHLFSHSLRWWEDLLYLEVEDMVIPVVLRQYFFTSSSKRFQGGFTNVEKLVQYLKLYLRYISKRDIAVEGDTSEVGLTPAVAAAIAAQGHPAEKGTEEDAPRAGEVTFFPRESSKYLEDFIFSEMDVFHLRERSSEVGITPAVAAAIAMQKKQSETQDKAPAEAPEQDTAPESQKEKPAPPSEKSKEVDVDALFNAILRENGKLK